MRHIDSVIMIVALALCCSGCSSSSGGPDASRTLRVAYQSDFKSMDPAISGDTETATFITLMYQGLLDCDDNMKLVPWLATEMPTMSEDKRVYTFHLKQGIRYSNGREMEARDFVYAIERTLDPATRSPWPSFLD